MKSGVQPWIGCGSKAGWLAAGAPSRPRCCAWPLPSSCALAGSLSTIRVSGRSRRSTRPTPVDRAAGAVAGDEIVEPRAGEIVDDLARGRRLVDVGIGRRLELAGEEPAVRLGQFDRLLVHAEALWARGVSTTLAPSMRISLRRSTEKLSAIVTTSGYPFWAQTIARPMPVLPLVASTTVCPGFSAPRRSASSMMLSASRSLTDAAGIEELGLDVDRARGRRRDC